MDDNIKWITRNGVHIPITNDYMNGKIRDSVAKKKNIVEASHITKVENVKSIKENGFDLKKSGSGAGNTFGKGIYFTNEQNEKEYWKWRIDHSSEIKADIDTTGFLKVEYNEYTSGNNFIEPILKAFNENDKKQYNQLLKQYKEENVIAEKLNEENNPNYKKYWHINEKQDAVNKVLETNYPGLIVKQTTPELDIITGGNQIVVYNVDRIKIKENKK